MQTAGTFRPEIGRALSERSHVNNAREALVHVTASSISYHTLDLSTSAQPAPTAALSTSA